jgi:ABC-type bacteriocin/lantibiotic exporter with double-glycine peptidase domain
LINNGLQRGNSCFIPVAAVTILVFVSGCSSFSGSSKKTISLSDEAVVLKVEFEKQKKENLCGLNSLVMLMRYWKVPGKPEVEKELAIQAESENGLSGNAVQKYLEECGFNVYLFNGVLSGDSRRSLFYHIDRGRPVLLLVSTGTGAKGHYMLITGYDAPQNRVVFIDPVRGRMALSYDKFERMWEPCERFSLLAVPK